MGCSIEAQLGGYHFTDDELVGLPVKVNGIPIGTVVSCHEGLATIDILEKEDLFSDRTQSWSIARSQDA